MDIEGGGRSWLGIWVREASGFSFLGLTKPALEHWVRRKGLLSLIGPTSSLTFIFPLWVNRSYSPYMIPATHPWTRGLGTI